MTNPRHDPRPHGLLGERRLPGDGGDGRHGGDGRVRGDVLGEVERERGLVEQQVVVLAGPASLGHVERGHLAQLLQSERLLCGADLGLADLL